MGLWLVVIALGLLGVVAAFFGRKEHKERERLLERGEAIEEDRPIVSEGCCGMHMTCERDSLLSSVSTRIVYYDDEELDRYAGREATDYSAEMVAEFREILLSLAEDEVAGWVRSLQLRGITFPEELTPELYLIVGEQRAYHMEHGPTSRQGY